MLCFFVFLQLVLDDKNRVRLS